MLPQKWATPTATVQLARGYTNQREAFLKKKIGRSTSASFKEGKNAECYKLDITKEDTHNT
jgi:hypothetical protein